MRIFRRVPVRLPWVVDRDLTLYDVTRACVLPHFALFCFAVVLVYYRGAWTSYTRAVFLALGGVAYVVEPAAATMNLYHNGWGAPERRFWCHLRAMYRQGHNPMRWAFDAFTDACLIYATTGDAFAYTAVALSYNAWCRAETARTTPVPQTTDQDFALALQPLHDEQIALERAAGDPGLVVAGASVIFATLMQGYIFWALYLTLLGANTALYVWSKQSYVQTDLQARCIGLLRIVLAVLV